MHISKISFVTIMAATAMLILFAAAPAGAEPAPKNFQLVKRLNAAPSGSAPLRALPVAYHAALPKPQSARPLPLPHKTALTALLPRWMKRETVSGNRPSPENKWRLRYGDRYASGMEWETQMALDLFPLGAAECYLEYRRLEDAIRTTGRAPVMGYVPSDFDEHSGTLRLRFPFE